MHDDGQSYATSISSTSLTASGLTPTRVTFAGTAGLLVDDADLTFVTDTLTSTKVVAPTSVSTPSLISTGALTITPAAGSNLNVNLSTTGDFAVNTNQLYVDTSATNVGIGVTNPAQKLEIQNNGNVYTRYRYNTGTPATNYWDVGVTAGGSGGILFTRLI